jgi:hypothetical protein
MKDEFEPETPRQGKRCLMWKEILLGALLLWIGATNLGPALDLHNEHRGTLAGVFLLVCECALLVGSGGAIALGARPLWMRHTAPAEGEEDWGGINAKRLRSLAIVSFAGLAWCLGSLP